MKKLILWLGFLFQFFVTGNIYSQKIGKVVKRTAQHKTEQKASQATGDAIDEGINGIKSIFKKKDKKSKNNSTDNAKETSGESEDPITADVDQAALDRPDTSAFGIYTKFTFEPGNKILFYDDFQKDALGDFPVQWETSGSGEVVTNSLFDGKWFSITGRAGYLPSTEELPENYTIEFDVLTDGFSDNNSASSLTVAFLKKKSYDMGAAGGHAHLQISLNKSAVINVGNTGAEKTPRIGSKLSRKFKLDTLVHFSIAVNKNRLRVWMEEDKIVDVPSLLVGNMGRYLLLTTYGINPEKGHTVLISNFKVAESNEDLRSQLLDSGRFSTTGIYFNTDKADIKPESFAIIKSVADYLKENPDVKIQIIGHTDAQGEEAYNQKLSEKRAQAVVEALVKQFSIDESRLSSAGKGETEPVDDNSTEKGRANNRRVEFIKI
jgi:OmpA-OmpF porin, OOP family